MAQKTAFFTFSPWGRGTSLRFMKAAEPHQHLVPPDVGGEASALIAAQAVRPAEDGPLGAEQVVEELFQPTARVPDQGGGVAHHPFHGEVPKDLDAVELHKAGGE